MLLLKPREKLNPAETWQKSVKQPTTLTGDDLLTVVLSPNRPPWTPALYPQPHAVPFCLTPSENARPAST